MKLMVLVVSERASQADWARMALGPGCDVEHAPNGIVALRRARDEPFDLVIAEQTTEPYGAFGLCRELKLGDDAPAVVIILERAQDDWLARWSGADRWLVRPVDPFELALVATELTSDPAATAAAAVAVSASPEPGEIPAPPEP